MEIRQIAGTWWRWGNRDDHDMPLVGVFAFGALAGLAVFATHLVLNGGPLAQSATFGLVFGGGMAYAGAIRWIGHRQRERGISPYRRVATASSLLLAPLLFVVGWFVLFSWQSLADVPPSDPDDLEGLISSLAWASTAAAVVLLVAFVGCTTVALRADIDRSSLTDVNAGPRQGR